MKAAILVKNKVPLTIADIELPKKLGYGQVLVKVRYSGICGAQINEIDAVKGPDKFLPHLLGHEGGGVVMDVGDGVRSVKKNDHVVMHWMRGDGIQAATAKYQWGNKTVNAGWVTTFNEYAVVSENRVTLIPKDYDLKLASLYGCAVTTAFGVIQNDAKLHAGDSILIFGCGGVGSAIIMAASVVGANPIIGVDINNYKLKKAKEFGATDVFNSKLKIQNAKFKQIIKQGVDVAVDTTGRKDIRELAYELTNPEGITVLVGVPKHGDKMCIDSFPLHFDKRITGSHGGDTQPDRDIPRLIRLEKSGRFNLNKLITHEFSLDNINQAIDMVRKGDTIRCVINMNK